jgi:hypothetical protein
MPLKKQPIILSLAVALALGATAVEAKKAKPSSIDEMWRIIEQQQKQIEELKSRITQNESAGEKRDEGQSAYSVSGDKASSTSAKVDSSAAQPTTTAKKSTRTESERKTDILASEVEKLKTQLYIPDKREYKVQYGYGPAASEVYRVNQGLSIGGYGEWVFSDYSQDKKSTIDNLRAVIYAGYKFNDWIILNNEFEFEHGTTGEGSEEKGEVSVEFSYLDFLLNDYANVRAGLTLVPMGFINEIHEGPTYHGNYRPEVERTIIPTTWREIGAGVFGQLAPGLQYRMYGMNGLNAEGFTSAGIREGRQSGSKAIAEDFAFTGRVDYDMPFAPGLLAGASAWVGNSGQGYEYSSQAYGRQEVNALTQLYEGHLQWHWQGIEMRALGAFGSIGNAAQLSAAKGETIGSQNYGWYTEAAYNVMPWLWKDTAQYIAPFFRYESYNTLASVPDGFDDYDGLYNRWIYQAGLTYKPIENVAVKFDYQNFNSAAKKLPDQFNLGIAFMY